ncbi:MAG: MarR family transcriptional regulator [Lachnospiraceae bacterium]|nr:MarR family transcriptional regulator [Lachnospiraceae bacterium]
MQKDNIISKDIVNLSNELLYQRFIFNREQIFQFLNELSMQEYVALHIMDDNESGMPSDQARTYLQDLMERMNLTVRKTSTMVKQLKERGLVHWLHDGDGSEGTYVVLTDMGKEMLRSQEERMTDYFSNVIVEFGIDRVIELLKLWRDLEDIMRKEIRKRGDA